MNRRNITIAVVGVLAIGIALVVYGILVAPRKSASPPRNVVIAAMNIPANTKIVPAMVTTEQKPTDQVEPTALSDPADAVGMLASADIPQGVVLTPTRLARPAPQPQGLQVAIGQRAVTIAVDNVKGVAGLLIPGDHVDVLAMPLRGTEAPRAYAIVRDARVLAVGRNTGAPEAAPTGSPAPAGAAKAPVANNTWITLAVKPAEADSIMAADIGGVVRLALRSAHEPARSMTAETIVYAEKKPAGSGSPKPQGVVVVNGSQVTRVVP